MGFEFATYFMGVGIVDDQPTLAFIFGVKPKATCEFRKENKQDFANTLDFRAI